MTHTRYAQVGKLLRRGKKRTGVFKHPPKDLSAYPQVPGD